MERFLESYYEPQFNLHFFNWLQNDVCQELFQLNGATKEDLALLDKTRDLEQIWSLLSVPLKKNLSQKDYKYGQIIQSKSIVWLQELDVVSSQLKVFSTLTLKEKNVLMNKYFPEVASSDQYPNNLHVQRNLNQAATSIIGSMSSNNWSRWQRLLQTLHPSIPKLSE
jgi:hypothetical protein